MLLSFNASSFPLERKSISCCSKITLEKGGMYDMAIQNIDNAGLTAGVVGKKMSIECFKHY